MKYSDVKTNSLCAVPGVGTIKAVHPTYGTKKNGDRVAIWPNDKVFPVAKRGANK